MTDTNCTKDSRQICTIVVRELLQNRDWALLDEDVLVKLVLNSTPPDLPLSELKRQAEHQYTIVLYEACKQEDDHARRERAYRELFHYLFRAAYNRWPDLAEDVTQRALVLVCEQIERCDHPGTFLAFALWKLRHALQLELKARGSNTPDVRIDPSFLDQVPAALSPHLDQESLQVLSEAIHRIPDARQREAVLLKFFGGLSDEEISERLGVSQGYLRVLRHRGLEQLRKDGKLGDYFPALRDREKGDETEL
jgi:RNA polymerase sigma factor (sigma-70 family)